MRRYAWVALIVVVIGGLLLRGWLKHAPALPKTSPASSASVHAPVGSVAEASSVMGSKHFLASAFRSIKPALKAKTTETALQQAQKDAVEHTRGEPNRLALLKALVAKGNAYAADKVGDMLALCLPSMQERLYAATKQTQTKIQQLATQLAALPSHAVSKATDLQSNIDIRNSAISEWGAKMEQCAKVSSAQAWSSFNWYERATAMGNDSSVLGFLKELTTTYYSPHVIGRNPQRAMRLRDHARRYLGDSLRHCTQSKLRDYAHYLPSLYALDAYGSYGMEYLRFLTHNEDADYARNLGKFAMPLTPAQQQAAQQQARAMFNACLGTAP